MEKNLMLNKTIRLTVLMCFLVSSMGPATQAHAANELGLPMPGTMVNLSPAFEPTLIKGLTIHKDNPFLFDFILDTGNSKMEGDELKKEGDRLIKYFFACLTIPEKDLWVNLSPYEKDRILPTALGATALGRDLLAQDYILKQLTASLIYPEKELGKSFWDKVYAKAQQVYGTTEIPVNTFNKVWIMADRAEVYEHGQTAFVVDKHLKVMLEEDYLALQKNAAIPANAGIQNKSHNIASQIVREIVLPEIEKEINTGKNFAMLRQVFNSLILASWYKKNLKEALLNQVYADKSTVNGVNLTDPSIKEKIYQQYLEAYKKGVFNFIKEDMNALTQTTIARKYFSGGVLGSMAMLSIKKALTPHGENWKPIGKFMKFVVAASAGVALATTDVPELKGLLYGVAMAMGGLMGITMLIPDKEATIMVRQPNGSFKLKISTMATLLLMNVAIYNYAKNLPSAAPMRVFPKSTAPAFDLEEHKASLSYKLDQTDFSRDQKFKAWSVFQFVIKSGFNPNGESNDILIDAIKKGASDRFATLAVIRNLLQQGQKGAPVDLPMDWNLPPAQRVFIQNVSKGPIKSNEAMITLEPGLLETIGDFIKRMYAEALRHNKSVMGKFNRQVLIVHAPEDNSGTIIGNVTNDPMKMLMEFKVKSQDMRAVDLPPGPFAYILSEFRKKRSTPDETLVANLHGILIYMTETYSDDAILDAYFKTFEQGGIDSWFHLHQNPPANAAMTTPSDKVFDQAFEKAKGPGSVVTRHTLDQAYVLAEKGPLGGLRARFGKLVGQASIIASDRIGIMVSSTGLVVSLNKTEFTDLMRELYRDAPFQAQEFLDGILVKDEPGVAGMIRAGDDAMTTSIPTGYVAYFIAIARAIGASLTNKDRFYLDDLIKSSGIRFIGKVKLVQRTPFENTALVLAESDDHKIVLNPSGAHSTPKIFITDAKGENLRPVIEHDKKNWSWPTKLYSFTINDVSRDQRWASITFEYDTQMRQADEKALVDLKTGDTYYGLAMDYSSKSVPFGFGGMVTTEGGRFPSVTILNARTKRSQRWMVEIRDVLALNETDDRYALVKKHDGFCALQVLPHNKIISLGAVIRARDIEDVTFQGETLSIKVKGYPIPAVWTVKDGKVARAEHPWAQSAAMLSVKMKEGTDFKAVFEASINHWLEEMAKKYPFSFGDRYGRYKFVLGPKPRNARTVEETKIGRYFLGAKLHTTYYADPKNYNTVDELADDLSKAVEFIAVEGQSPAKMRASLLAHLEADDFDVNSAMSANLAAKISNAATAPGGIDLNTADMGMTVTKDANGGVKVNFDPAMIERIRKNGVGRVEPFIIQMQFLKPEALRPLLGLAPATPVA